MLQLKARRILFLDVDGVLNCTSDGRTGRSDVLRPALLRRLGALARSAAASLVLSSSWRAYPGLVSRLRDALQEVAGVEESAFVGMTGSDQPPGGCEGRAKEIEAWLKVHMGNGGSEIGGPIESWCVIDDLPMGALPFLAGHFVRVDPRVGLSEGDAARAKQILLSRRTKSDAKRNRGSSSGEERRAGVGGSGTRGGRGGEDGAGGMIAKTIDEGVESLAQQYNVHLQQVERENQLAEHERLRQAKSILLEDGANAGGAGAGGATTVLFDTGASFLELSPRLVVGMLDTKMATLES
jgi:hypothetical protein